MGLVVQKFGGTSVADATRILAAARRMVAAKRAGHQVVAVVSARGEKTDELIDLARQITDDPAPREMDMLLSTGEQESVALVAMGVRALGEESISLTGAQIGILTDSTYTKARIRRISTERMRKALDEGKIVIAAGFQGIDDDFNITTLGRGGSDTTATALAAVLNADVCEIYTDVEGIFTTDPRLVKNARKLDRISYDELLELASLGGGKMHSRSIEFAKKYQVPLCVRPSFADGPGTLIGPQQDDSAPLVTGVALAKDEAIVNLRGLPDRPGVLSTIFACMAERKIPIDMVVQNVAEEGLAQVSFTVPQTDLAEALTAAEASVKSLGTGTVQHGTNVSKLSIVGGGMRTHTGVAAQMFRALAAAEVSLLMITTSEIKVSVLVNRDASVRSLEATHAGFRLDQESSTALPAGVSSLGATRAPRLAQEELERDVVSRLGSMEDIVVSEVLRDDSQSRITLRNIPDRPGIAAEILTAVAEGGVVVDMIVQSLTHNNRAEVSFTVPRVDMERAKQLLNPVVSGMPGATLSHQSEMSMLLVAGIGLRTHTGVAARMFSALAEANVNVEMVNTSEIRMSVVVAPKDADRAAAALSTAFGLK